MIIQKKVKNISKILWIYIPQKLNLVGCGTRIIFRGNKVETFTPRRKTSNLAKISIGR